MTVDVAAWAFNIVTSVGIIIVNKALMATYGFSFGTLYTCVEGLHVLVLFLHLSCWLFLLLHPLVYNGARLFCVCFNEGQVFGSFSHEI